MIDRGKHDVLGVGINAADYEFVVNRVVDAAQNHRPLSLTALAVHGVMTGALDATHRHRLNHFDLAVPDGQPVRWALRVLHGISLPDRVYGPTLTLKICERLSNEGLSVFFYGSRPEVLTALRRRLTFRFPSLRIAGMESSKFRKLSDAERDAMIERIRSSGAALTFVGLGCPRQEVWCYENRDRLSMPVLAVGAAFDFHAGILPQAPLRLQALGLEWFYRLIQEPRRLWRRYLLLNPVFVAGVTAQLMRVRTFQTTGVRPLLEERFG